MIEAVVAAVSIANGAVKLASNMDETMDRGQESDILQKPAILLRNRIEKSKKFRATDSPDYGEHSLRAVGNYSQYVCSFVEISPKAISKHLMYALRRVRRTDVIHLYKLTLKEEAREAIQTGSREIVSDDIIQVEFDLEKVLELYLLKRWTLPYFLATRKATLGLTKKSRVYYK
jgi:hypothetical protein